MKAYRKTYLGKSSQIADLVQTNANYGKQLVASLQEIFTLFHRKHESKVIEGLRANPIDVVFTPKTSNPDAYDVTTDKPTDELKQAGII